MRVTIYYCMRIARPHAPFCVLVHAQALYIPYTNNAMLNVKFVCNTNLMPNINHALNTKCVRNTNLVLGIVGVECLNRDAQHQGCAQNQVCGQH